MAAHHAQFRVYYEDTDAGGVMYHAQYLAFAERGRSEALRDAGASAASLVEQHGIAFVVRRASLEYLRPLRLDDLVTITTEVADCRSASVRLRQTLSRDGVVHATIDVTLVTIRMSDGRPVRMPEPWGGIMASLVASGETAVA